MSCLTDGLYRHILCESVPFPRQICPGGDGFYSSRVRRRDAPQCPRHPGLLNVAYLTVDCHPATPCVLPESGGGREGDQAEPDHTRRYLRRKLSLVFQTVQVTRRVCPALTKSGLVLHAKLSRFGQESLGHSLPVGDTGTWGMGHKAGTRHPCYSEAFTARSRCQIHVFH